MNPLCCKALIGGNYFWAHSEIWKLSDFLLGPLSERLIASTFSSQLEPVQFVWEILTVYCSSHSAQLCNVASELYNPGVRRNRRDVQIMELFTKWKSRSWVQCSHSYTDF